MNKRLNKYLLLAIGTIGTVIYMIFVDFFLIYVAITGTGTLDRDFLEPFEAFVLFPLFIIISVVASWYFVRKSNDIYEKRDRGEFD